MPGTPRADQDPAVPRHGAAVNVLPALAALTAAAALVADAAPAADAADAGKADAEKAAQEILKALGEARVLDLKARQELERAEAALAKLAQDQKKDPEQDSAEAGAKAAGEASEKAVEAAKQNADEARRAVDLARLKAQNLADETRVRDPEIADRIRAATIDAADKSPKSPESPKSPDAESPAPVPPTSPEASESPPESKPTGRLAAVGGAKGLSAMLIGVGLVGMAVAPPMAAVVLVAGLVLGAVQVAKSARARKAVKGVFKKLRGGGREAGQGDQPSHEAATKTEPKAGASAPGASPLPAPGGDASRDAAATAPVLGGAAARAALSAVPSAQPRTGPGVGPITGPLGGRPPQPRAGEPGHFTVVGNSTRPPAAVPRVGPRRGLGG